MPLTVYTIRLFSLFFLIPSSLLPRINSAINLYPAAYPKSSKKSASSYIGLTSYNIVFAPLLFYCILLLLPIISLSYSCCPLPKNARRFLANGHFRYSQAFHHLRFIHFLLSATAWKATAAAAMVRSMSSSLCAPLIKRVSNWEGAK